MEILHFERNKINQSFAFRVKENKQFMLLHFPLLIQLKFQVIGDTSVCCFFGRWGGVFVCVIICRCPEFQVYPIKKKTLHITNCIVFKVIRSRLV